MPDTPKKILVINLGSSSTKAAYYEDENCLFKENLSHPAEELKEFPALWDQEGYRLAKVEDFLTRHGLKVAELDAVVTRGGHTRPLDGGVYRINEVMMAESRSEKFGVHACDLGMRIAEAFSAQGPVPLTAYPPVTDEFEPLARYSGLPEMPRRSSFHALNHKGVARQYAKDAGRPYEDLNLIVVHMGGGISVSPHKRGRMVDANNAILGDGPFCTNRTGTLPSGPLIDACFSGDYTRESLRRRLNGNGGMMAFVGESDTLTVEKRAAAGDEKCSEVLDAMAYQTAKEIGGAAAVLKGRVNAIVLTGGMANSKRLTEAIVERVGFIAPVHLYPGEFEMESLALSALEVLRGQREALALK